MARQRERERKRKREGRLLLLHASREFFLLLIEDFDLFFIILKLYIRLVSISVRLFFSLCTEKRVCCALIGILVKMDKSEFSKFIIYNFSF